MIPLRDEVALALLPGYEVFASSEVVLLGARGSEEREDNLAGVPLPARTHDVAVPEESDQRRAAVREARQRTPLAVAAESRDLELDAAALGDRQADLDAVIERRPADDPAELFAVLDSDRAEVGLVRVPRLDRYEVS